MRYLLLLYGDESRWTEASPENIQRTMADYAAFTREVEAAGAWVAGEGLQPTNAATTVRVRDGEVVLSDGPFAETREQLGGFYELECADLDEAIRWASKVPAVFAGSVEVRPVVDYEVASGRAADGAGRAQA
ncbi:MAG: YciI family protein [Solirubrobacteraceae bacterium]